MNTNQLEYLIEISKHNSMSAASEELHMSPQALSMSIKKLEEELGFTLLHRSFKGITLTSDGEWLVNEASSFLNKLHERQHLHQKGLTNTQHTGNLDIFINHSGINNNILGQVICTLLEKEPNLIINLQEISKNEIIHKVFSNDNEFGFIFRTTYNDVYTDTLPDGLIFDPYLDGDLVFSTSQHSEFAKFKSISLKKAVQSPLCSYSPHSEPQILLDNFFCDTLHLSSHLSTETNFSIYSQKILHGVASSLGVQFSTENHPTNFVDGSKILHIRDDVKIYLGCIYRNDAELSENALFFLKELKIFIDRLKSQR